MEGRIYDFAAAALTDAERFVVLVLGDIALIVAQKEIQALEPVLDVKSLDVRSVARPATSKDTNAAGILVLPGGTCSVYALDEELGLLPKIPAQHRICAIMNHRREPYALSCKEVRLLPRTALTLHEIPRPLHRQNTVSPVKTLVVGDDRLLLGTTAAALFAHVSRSNEAEVISFDEHARKARL